MKIHRKSSGYSKAWGYDLVIKRSDLYAKLEKIGLTPRKTATIGPLCVPDIRFVDFLRGVIDGDGCIRKWFHPSNGREQWTVFVVGISRPFLQWLGESVERLWGIKGALHTDPPKDEAHRTKYSLKYGKLAAKAIFTKCYYPGAFALDRKARLAAECISASVGWSKSKTVSRKRLWRDWQYQHIYGTQTISKVLDKRTFTIGDSEFIVRCNCRGVGTVDDGALKASGRKAVRVRLPPPARTDFEKLRAHSSVG